MKITLLNNPRCFKVMLFIAALLLHAVSFSQTRFYLNLNTAAPLTPAYNVGWNVTTGANRYIMSPTKDGSAITSKTTAGVTGVAVGKALLDQWMSAPLAAQTIAAGSTFTGQIRFNMSSVTSATGTGYVYLRIVNANGTIASEVGNVITSALTATLTNRTLISLSIPTAINITAGQRICIDLGWSYNITATVSRTCTISRGSSSATDLAVDNTTTTANNPWVQFSQTLLFLPVNDDCSGATLLTSATACTNITSNIQYATSNGPAGACGGATAGTTYDVWFNFVAASTTQMITLSSLGSNLTAANTYIETLSGSCGSLTSLGCQTAATTQILSGLTVGTTYYIRVYVTAAPTNSNTTNWNFNICLQNGPINDECSGATLLTSGSTCTNIAGTLLNAIPTSGLPSCGNSGSADVWYKFVAQSNRPVISLSGLGASITAASPYIQLFSGACGNLVQVACVSGSTLNTAVTPGGLGLSINSTYYIRITTNTNTGFINSGTWGYNICITDAAGATVDYAKSYINVTDGTVGGTIDTGDVLEIRAILVVARPGSSTANVAIDSVAYYDTLSAGKGLRLLKDSMALRTNEGKLFRPSNSTYFTDTHDGDAAWITTAGVGADTALQINMGTGATGLARGKIRYNSKPSNFGSTCIIMATYRVKVNAVYGTKIKYGGGAFRYRDSTTNTFYTINFPNDSLMVFESPGACPDAVSPTNIVGDEVNGTFGAVTGSPTFPQNRGTSPNTNYSYSPFGGGNGPGDYFYSVANNTSGNGTIVQTVPKPSATNRVFGVWDISGDHTGATNTAKGNPPCNLSAPVSPTNPCGYMLVVNAAYRTDVAFQFNFTGACTETYYEISAWIKNICSKCGCDSNGTGSTNAGYLPTAPNDSAGVRPNIAFQINGVDYYTTGDMLYQGLGGTQTGSDTLNKWVKKSFVYKTKPNETGFTMTFRNNAPGGGGNDWAVDDISIRTCYPNMVYSPSNTPSICAGHTLTITDTVRSYYNVYIYYKWQRSTDGGVTWSDIAGTSGVASPVLISPNNFQFIRSYTLPPTATTMANNGDKYRMVVATNAANLAGASCNYSDITPISLTVLNSCIDIDDDNDGIPDYVEFNNPVALQDANGNGIPNWNDPTYPGYVDNNLDNVNDNFDYGADSDNDGIPNYKDTDFPGFVDTNGDGVNDNADKDLDGIINQYDLDSDNDGIPDVVESYGVDANGDGIIDNYVDTDNDGFSQNVDANNTGVNGSNVGLGAQDFDGDGIPNYLDLDSDNDGIPDLVESGGADVNNNGRIDVFVDANFDGISDNDVNLTALLKTGTDVSPVDGRADNYPNKNLDRDFRPNAYDVDADGDGIVDVIEAGLPDANLNGIVDGVIGANGWSATVSSMVALNLRNTDGSGNPDYLDIDSDDDGIPDNIEGMSTAGYILPGTTDTDGDGLVNTYDNVVGFSGSGIFVYDHDGDGIPDYRDTDTDGDGAPDVVEGNDFNLNNLADDNVTLTGLDTDGDGLDNRFDSLNSVTNVKGTSYRMGTGGTFIGDATPGSRTTVQKKNVGQIDRDWRYVGVVLPVEFISFAGMPQNKQVQLNWTIIASKEVDHFDVERSLDNSNYTKVGTISDPVKLNEQQSFATTDDITGIRNEIIYYRLKVIGKNGDSKYSNVLTVRQKQASTPVTIMPNPASSNVTINLYTDKNMDVKIILLDKLGRKAVNQSQSLAKGYNNITLALDTYSEGVYALIIETPTEKIVKQLIIAR